MSTFIFGKVARMAGFHVPFIAGRLCLQNVLITYDDVRFFVTDVYNRSMKII